MSQVFDYIELDGRPCSAKVVSSYLGVLISTDRNSLLNFGGIFTILDLFQ